MSASSASVSHSSTYTRSQSRSGSTCKSSRSESTSKTGTTSRSSGQTSESRSGRTSDSNSGRTSESQSGDTSTTTASRSGSKSVRFNVDPDGKPPSRNPFINFTRHYRRQNAQKKMTMPELFKCAGKAWNCMDEKQKDKYRRMAKSAIAPNRVKSE